MGHLYIQANWTYDNCKSSQIYNEDPLMSLVKVNGSLATENCVVIWVFPKYHKIQKQLLRLLKKLEFLVKKTLTMNFNYRNLYLRGCTRDTLLGVFYIFICFKKFFACKRCYNIERKELTSSCSLSILLMEFSPINELFRVYHDDVKRIHPVKLI